MLVLKLHSLPEALYFHCIILYYNIVLLDVIDFLFCFVYLDVLEGFQLHAYNF